MSEVEALRAHVEKLEHKVDTLNDSIKDLGILKMAILTGRKTC